MNTFRIGIDCRLAGKKHAGIGRYIENLITHLVKIAPETITWVFYFHDRQQATEIFPTISEKIELKFVPIRHYTLKEQWKMPLAFSEKNLDLLHVPHFNIPLFYSGKMVTTIHDLLWHEYKGSQVTTLPMWQYWLKHRAYLFTTQQAVNRSERVIVPSQAVEQTLTKYYPQAKTKTTVIYEGVDNQFQMKKANNQPKKQLVYLGSLYPHKNIAIVLKALKELPEYKLLLIGTRNVFQEEVREQVKKLSLENQIEFLGYKGDEEIATLLNESMALVQPSLFEGFGLTGLEAMKAKTAVIASDIPVFHEVYQNAAKFFSPQDVNSFLSAVKEVQSDTSREKLITEGKKVVEQYQWELTAKQTLTVYENVLTNQTASSQQT